MKITFKILLLGGVLLVLSLTPNNVNAQTKKVDALENAFIREANFVLEYNTGTKEALKIYSQYQTEGLNMLIMDKLSFKELYSYQVKMIALGSVVVMLRERSHWYNFNQNREYKKLIAKTKRNISLADALMKLTPTS